MKTLLALTLAIGLGLGFVAGLFTSTSDIVKDTRPFSLTNELTVPVYYDGGGAVTDYVFKYGTFRDKGKWLRIDGPCFSACTGFLNLLPLEHVCATKRADFGLHGVYYSDGTPLPDWSYHQLQDLLLPASVQDMLERDGLDRSVPMGSVNDGKDDGFIHYTAADLGVQPCPEYE